MTGKEEDRKTRTNAAVESSCSLLDGALEADKSHIEDLKTCVLHRMRHDSKLDVIKSDELILKVGSSLLKRVGTKDRRRIAARMRLLAKLLHTLRKLSKLPDASLSQFIDGIYFDAVLETVEEMSK